MVLVRRRNPRFLPGQAPVSTPSYLFMVGAELVGITDDSTRHDTLPCIYFISTLYLDCAGPGWRGFPAPPTPRLSTGKMTRPERDLMQPLRSNNQKECPQFCGRYVTCVIYYKCGYINHHLSFIIHYQLLSTYHHAVSLSGYIQLGKPSVIPPRLLLEVGGTSTLQADMPIKLKSPAL